MRRGRQARAARRWAEAEAALEAALDSESAARLTPLQRAEVMGEVGLCEIEQRKYRDAAEHLSRSLDHFLELRPAFRRQLNNARTEAQKHVGRIFFSADPPDAAVLLDGELMGRAAVTVELFVEPGKHTIRAQLGGYQDVRQTFDIAAGQSHQISLSLPKTPEPLARVKEAASETWRAPRAASTPRVVEPGVWASWPGMLRIGGIALTTATLSAGAVLMIRSSALTDDIHERIDGLNDDPRWTSYSCRQAPHLSACAELRHLQANRDVAGEVGTAMVATGAVLGAVTAASFFVTDFSSLRAGPPRDRISVSALPMITGQQVLLTIRGAW